MFELTIFNSIYDKETTKKMVFDDFDKLESFFKKCFVSYAFEEKKDARLFSPAVYKSGTTRNNNSVEKFSKWFAADIDSFKFEKSGTIQEQLEKSFPLSLGKYRYFGYSTARSSEKQPKLRFIFELSDEIQPDKITIFWHAINQILGHSIDKQTKDHARMFYQPGQYKGAFSFFFSSVPNNEIINPTKLISDYDNEFLVTQTFKESLPNFIIEELQRLKQNRLTKNYQWSDWRDCPFVSKEQVNKYNAIVVMGTTGRYLGLYQLMVSIASIAIKKQYPITVSEVESIARDIDNSIDGYYRKRKITNEAEHAVAFAYKSL